jgi:hypothetical protein
MNAKSMEAEGKQVRADWEAMDPRTRGIFPVRDPEVRSLPHTHTHANTNTHACAYK